MKSVLLLSSICLAAVSANPAAGKKWHWKPVYPLLPAEGNGVKDVEEKSEPQPYQRGTIKVDQCGRVDNSRIVGGSESIAHAWPWLVAVFIGSSSFCSGVLISDQWVATAAHCTKAGSSFEIVMGAQDLSINEPSQITMVSTNKTTHEDFSSFYLVNDIGVIALPNPVPLSVGGISNVVRQVTVPIITQQECADVYGDLTVKNTTICTSGENGMGTCNGDSGGPLNYDDNGIYFLRGLVSFGHVAGCEKGYPNGYTKIIKYLDWIETHTGIFIYP